MLIATKHFLQSLNIRVFGLIALVMLPGNVLLFFQVYEQRQSAREAIRQQAIFSVDVLAQDQLRLIENTRQYLQALASFPVALKPEGAECGHFLNRILKISPNFINLGIPRADGELLCNAFPLKKHINVADRSYIRRTFETRDFTIGEFQLDRAADISSVNFAYPVINPENDTLIGAAVAVMSLSRWSNSLNESHLPQNAIAYIADLDNRISAYYPADKKKLGIKVEKLQINVLETEQLAEYKITLTKNTEGVGYIFASKQLLMDSIKNTVTVTVGIPTDQAMAAINSEFVSKITIMGVSFIPMFVFIFFVVRISFLNPVKKLSQGMLDFQEGRPVDILLHSGIHELRELSKQFDVMIKTRLDMEKQLKESEQKLLHAQEIAHIGHWVLDSVNDTLSWSDEVFHIFELDPKQVTASNDVFFEMVHPDDRTFVANAYKNSVEKKAPYNIEHRLLMKDGRVKYVNERCQTIYDDEGKPNSMGTVMDITTQKQAELKLKETEGRFRTVFNQQFQFMAILSEEGVTLEVNELVLSKQGVTAEDYVGKLIWDSPAWRDFPEWREIWPQRLEQVRHMHKPLLTEDTYQTVDGSIQYADASTLALRNNNGQVSGFLIQATDVTEHRLATSHAKDMDNILSSVFQLLNDIFFLLDLKGTILNYRVRDEGELYTTPEEFLGKTMQEVLPPEVTELFMKYLKKNE